MASPAESLKTFAVSRLLFDNVPHLKNFWVMHGLSVAQLSLNFGVDDLDGSVVEYKITHDADSYGTPNTMHRDDLLHLIWDAGFTPVERDTRYQVVKETERRLTAELLALRLREIDSGAEVQDSAVRECELRMQQALGVALKVAVNISPRQFMNAGLVATVRDALLRTSLDPSQLDLEITESVLMDKLSGDSTALSELNALGVKISIDDFGTGYSNLSYLKRYPIGKLKIDQSFVHDMTGNPGDAALIAAIIAMGHSLKIPVLAEGIETPEQLAFLTASNCDLGQGFYIGKPMPLEALLQWFSDTTRWKPGKAQSQPNMAL
jgi:EAL domain-containing protein (putative c-di-GMP-specific phosphodiesterase class I)